MNINDDKATPKKDRIDESQSVLYEDDFENTSGSRSLTNALKYSAKFGEVDMNASIEESLVVPLDASIKKKTHFDKYEQSITMDKVREDQSHEEIESSISQSINDPKENKDYE